MNRARMNLGMIILASLAVAAGAIGTLTLLTLEMAGGANSSEAQIRQLKMWMLVTGVGGLVSLAGGIWLIVKGMPGWGGLLGALPMIVLVVGIIWVSIRSEFF